MRQAFWRVLFLLAVLVLASGKGFAGEPYAASGFYVGGDFYYHAVGGDFEADSGYQTVPPLKPAIILLGEIDNGPGWGARLGYRGPNFAVEFAYLKSRHDDFNEIFMEEGKTAIDILDLNLKYFFFSEKKLQPFLLLGASYIWLEQRDRTLVLSDDEVDPEIIEIRDAKYNNFALNAGAGLSYLVTPKVALNTGVNYRWTEFDKNRGYETGDLDPPIDFNMVSYNLGLTYTFPFK